MFRPIAVIIALVLAGGAGARDELGPVPHCATGGVAALQGRPPLFDGLGGISYPAGANAEAQAYFDQGLRWAYAFNHAEARRAFAEAQKLDPACALCAWGEALVLGPNINKPMDEADLPIARAAAQRAERLARTDKERLLAQAVRIRYGEGERAALDAAYGEAMVRLTRRFPEDANLHVLAAEALMDSQPWDYWEADRITPKGNHAQTMSLLERVLAEQPNHPGAIHLYIHAVEASAEPQRALEPARRLAALMPAAGHIVHMPSHIYYRVGLWKDSLETNRQAVQADERYFARAGVAPGIYRNGYYPHNIHFLLVSAQMGGDGATALAAADRLAATITEDAARTVPWAQPIKAAPYFTHAQFSPPDTILALPDPGDGLPYVKALWHYVRGTAFAAQSDAYAVTREAAAIRSLSKTGAIGQLEKDGVPAGPVLQLAALVLDARAAQAQGQLEESAAKFRQAVTLEDSLSYTEPPWWYYPVHQSLGATLMMAGDSAGAERVFRQALDKVPNNGWALWGLAQAQKAQGKDSRATEEAFRKAWFGADLEPQLAGL